VSDEGIENEDAAEYENEDAGFEQAPKELFLTGYERDPDAPFLSHGAVRLYLLLRHFGATANFRISVAKIATAMGCTDRTVRNLRAELLAAGWLQVTPTYRDTGDRGRSSNRYKVMWRRIKGEDDPRARAHEALLAKGEAARAEAKRARRAGGTPPMFP
jgi:hypothetical protein